MKLHLPVKLRASLIAAVIAVTASVYNARAVSYEAPSDEFGWKGNDITLTEQYNKLAGNTYTATQTDYDVYEFYTEPGCTEIRVAYASAADGSPVRLDWDPNTERYVGTVDGVDVSYAPDAELEGKISFPSLGQTTDDPANIIIAAAGQTSNVTSYSDGQTTLTAGGKIEFQNNFGSGVNALKPTDTTKFIGAQVFDAPALVINSNNNNGQGSEVVLEDATIRNVTTTTIAASSRLTVLDGDTSTLTENEKTTLGITGIASNADTNWDDANAVTLGAVSGNGSLAVIGGKERSEDTVVDGAITEHAYDKAVGKDDKLDVSITSIGHTTTDKSKDFGNVAIANADVTVANGINNVNTLGLVNSDTTVETGGISAFGIDVNSESTLTAEQGDITNSTNQGAGHVSVHGKVVAEDGNIRFTNGKHYLGSGVFEGARVEASKSVLLSNVDATKVAELSAGDNLTVTTDSTITGSDNVTVGDDLYLRNGSTITDSTLTVGDDIEVLDGGKGSSHIVNSTITVTGTGDDSDATTQNVSLANGATMTDSHIIGGNGDIVLDGSKQDANGQNMTIVVGLGADAAEGTTADFLNTAEAQKGNLAAVLGVAENTTPLTSAALDAAGMKVGSSIEHSSGNVTIKDATVTSTLITGGGDVAIGDATETGNPGHAGTSAEGPACETIETVLTAIKGGTLVDADLDAAADAFPTQVEGSIIDVRGNLAADPTAVNDLSIDAAAVSNTIILGVTGSIHAEDALVNNNFIDGGAGLDIQHSAVIDTDIVNLTADIKISGESAIVGTNPDKKVVLTTQGTAEITDKDTYTGGSIILSDVAMENVAIKSGVKTTVNADGTYTHTPVADTTTEVGTSTTPGGTVDGALTGVVLPYGEIDIDDSTLKAMEITTAKGNVNIDGTTLLESVVETGVGNIDIVDQSGVGNTTITSKGAGNITIDESKVSGSSITAAGAGNISITNSEVGEGVSVIDDAATAHVFDTTITTGAAGNIDIVDSTLTNVKTATGGDGNITITDATMLDSIATTAGAGDITITTSSIRVSDNGADSTLPKATVSTGGAGNIEITTNSDLDDTDVKTGGEGHILIDTSTMHRGDIATNGQGADDYITITDSTLVDANVSTQGDGDITITTSSISVSDNSATSAMPSASISVAGKGDIVITTSDLDDTDVTAGGEGHIEIAGSTVHRGDISTNGQGADDYIAIVNSTLEDANVSTQGAGDIVITTSSISVSDSSDTSAMPKATISVAGAGNIEITAKSDLDDTNVTTGGEGNIVIDDSAVTNGTVSTAGDGYIAITTDSDVDTATISTEGDGAIYINHSDVDDSLVRNNGTGDITIMNEAHVGTSTVSTQDGNISILANSEVLSSTVTSAKDGNITIHDSLVQDSTVHNDHENGGLGDIEILQSHIVNSSVQTGVGDIQIGTPATGTPMVGWNAQKDADKVDTLVEGSLITTTDGGFTIDESYVDSLTTTDADGATTYTKTTIKATDDSVITGTVVSGSDITVSDGDLLIRSHSAITGDVNLLVENGTITVNDNTNYATQFDLNGDRVAAGTRDASIVAENLDLYFMKEYNGSLSNGQIAVENMTSIRAHSEWWGATNVGLTLDNVNNAEGEAPGTLGDLVEYNGDAADVSLHVKGGSIVEIDKIYAGQTADKSLLVNAADGAADALNYFGNVNVAGDSLVTVQDTAMVKNYREGTIATDTEGSKVTFQKDAHLTNATIKGTGEYEGDAVGSKGAVTSILADGHVGNLDITDGGVLSLNAGAQADASTHSYISNIGNSDGTINVINQVLSTPELDHADLSLGLNGGTVVLEGVAAADGATVASTKPVNAHVSLLEITNAGKAGAPDQTPYGQSTIKTDLTVLESPYSSTVGDAVTHTGKQLYYAVNADHTLQGTETYTVYDPTTGTTSELSAANGDTLKAGQIVVKVDTVVSDSITLADGTTYNKAVAVDAVGAASLTATEQGFLQRITVPVLDAEGNLQFQPIDGTNEGTLLVGQKYTTYDIITHPNASETLASIADKTDGIASLTVAKDMDSDNTYIRAYEVVEKDALGNPAITNGVVSTDPNSGYITITGVVSGQDNVLIADKDISLGGIVTNEASGADYVNNNIVASVRGDVKIGDKGIVGSENMIVAAEGNISVTGDIQGNGNILGALKNITTNDIIGDDNLLYSAEGNVSTGEVTGDKNMLGAVEGNVLTEDITGDENLVVAGKSVTVNGALMGDSNEITAQDGTVSITEGILADADDASSDLNTISSTNGNIEIGATDGKSLVGSENTLTATTGDIILTGDTVGNDNVLTATTDGTTGGNIMVDDIEGDSNVLTADKAIETETITGDSNTLVAGTTIDTADITGDSNDLDAVEKITVDGTITGDGNMLTSATDAIEVTGSIVGDSNDLDAVKDITVGGGIEGDLNTLTSTEGGIAVTGTIMGDQNDLDARQDISVGGIVGDDNMLTSTEGDIAVTGSIVGEGNELEAHKGSITVDGNVMGENPANPNALTAAETVTIDGTLGGVGTQVTAYASGLSQDDVAISIGVFAAQGTDLSIATTSSPVYGTTNGNGAIIIGSMDAAQNADGSPATVDASLVNSIVSNNSYVQVGGMKGSNAYTTITAAKDVLIGTAGDTTEDTGANLTITGKNLVVNSGTELTLTDSSVNVTGSITGTSLTLTTTGTTEFASSAHSVDLDSLTVGGSASLTAGSVVVDNLTIDGKAATLNSTNLTVNESLTIQNGADAWLNRVTVPVITIDSSSLTTSSINGLESLYVQNGSQVSITQGLTLRDSDPDDGIDGGELGVTGGSVLGVTGAIDIEGTITAGDSTGAGTITTASTIKGGSIAASNGSTITGTSGIESIGSMSADNADIISSGTVKAGTTMDVTNSGAVTGKSIDVEGALTVTNGDVTATGGSIEAASATITGGELSATKGVATTGDITAVADANGGRSTITGDITTAANVSLTDSDVTGKVNLTGDLAVTNGSVGNVTGARTVQLSHATTGSITMAAATKSRALSERDVTAEDNTVINGNITGANNITLTDSTVEGSLVDMTGALSMTRATARNVNGATSATLNDATIGTLSLTGADADVTAENGSEIASITGANDVTLTDSTVAGAIGMSGDLLATNATMGAVTGAGNVTLKNVSSAGDITMTGALSADNAQMGAVSGAASANLSNGSSAASLAMNNGAVTLANATVNGTVTGATSVKAEHSDIHGAVTMNGELTLTDGEIASITEDSTVTAATITDATIGSGLTVQNAALVSGSTIKGDLKAGSATVSNASTITGNLTTTAGDASVSGSSSIGGNVEATGGNASVDNSAVTGNLSSTTGSVAVTGAATIGGNATGQTGVTVSGGSTVTGAVTATTGNATIAGSTVGSVSAAGGTADLDNAIVTGGVSAGTVDMLGGSVGADVESTTGSATIGNATIGGSVTGATGATVTDSTVKGSITATTGDAIVSNATAGAVSGENATITGGSVAGVTATTGDATISGGASITGDVLAATNATVENSTVKGSITATAGDAIVSGSSADSVTAGGLADLDNAIVTGGVSAGTVDMLGGSAGSVEATTGSAIVGNATIGGAVTGATGATVTDSTVTGSITATTGDAIVSGSSADSVTAGGLADLDNAIVTGGVSAGTVDMLGGSAGSVEATTGSATVGNAAIGGAVTGATGATVTDSTVTGSITATTGDAIVSNTTAGAVSGENATITGGSVAGVTATTGDATISGGADVAGSVAAANGTVTVEGATVDGTVSGAAVNVTNGTIGTGVTSTGNATITDSTVTGGVTVDGDAIVSGTTVTGSVSGANATITGGSVAGVTTTGDATITDSTVLTGGVKAEGDAIVSGTTVTGSVSGENVTMTGGSVSKGDVTADTTATLSGVEVTGSVSGATASITGGSVGGNVEADDVTLSETQIGGNVTADNLTSNGDVTVGGTVEVSNDLTVNNGNLTADGAVTVQGSTSFNGGSVVADKFITNGMTITGDAEFDGNLELPTGDLVLTGNTTLVNGDTDVKAGTTRLDGAQLNGTLDTSKLTSTGLTATNGSTVTMPGGLDLNNGGLTLGNSTVNGNVTEAGTVNMTGGSEVNGSISGATDATIADSSVTGSIGMSGALSVTNGSAGDVTGATSAVLDKGIIGALELTGDNANVTATNGSSITSIADAKDVTLAGSTSGAITMSGALDADHATITGDVTGASSADLSYTNLSGALVVNGGDVEVYSSTTEAISGAGNVELTDASTAGISLSGELGVYGSDVFGDVTGATDVTLKDSSTVAGNITMSGDLEVAGGSVISGAVTGAEDATLMDNSSVADLSLSGVLHAGNGTTMGDVTAGSTYIDGVVEGNSLSTGDFVVGAGHSYSACGDVTADGEIAIMGDVSSEMGNISLKGGEYSAIIDAAVSALGDVTLDGSISIMDATITGDEVAIDGTASAEDTTIKSYTKGITVEGTLNAGEATVLDGTVTGTGTINKTGGDTLALAADTDMTGGAINVAEGSTLLAEEGARLGALSLTGGSTLDLTTPAANQKARAAAPATIGTVTADSIVATKDDTLKADLDLASASADKVTAGTHDYNGATLELSTVEPGQEGSVADQTRITVADGGTIASSLNEDVTHDLDTLNAHTENMGDRIDLVLSKNYKGAEKTENQAQVANGVASLNPEAVKGTELENVLDAMAHTRSEADAVAALDSLGGMGYAGMQKLIADDAHEHLQTLRSTLESVSADVRRRYDSNGYRMEDVQSSAIAAVVTGGASEVGGNGNCGDYTRSSFGAMLAGAHAVSNEWTFGADLAYSYVDGDCSDAVFSGDAIYFDIAMMQKRGRFTQTGTIGAGFYRFETERDVTISAKGHDYSGHAEGSTNASAINLSYEASYDLIRSKTGHSFSSLVMAEACFVSIDGMEEEGMGNAGLRSEFDDMASITLGVGARYSYAFGKESNPGYFALEAMLVADAGDDITKVNNQFIGGGQTFNLVGPEAGDIGLRVNAGLLIPIGEQWGIFGNVTSEFRAEQSSVGGGAGVKYSF